jgi:GNAT superfamily N-acetyltransferase
LAKVNDIVVRPRTDDDLDACVQIAAAVHSLDGYPPYLPDGDFRALLTRPRALAAYVAIDEGHIIGHVALHSARANPAVKLASEALACEVGQLGVVARLFTAPAARGAGVGRALLHAAAHAARVRDLVPILDVWVELKSAIAMYESCGWRNLGTVDAELPDGRVLPEYVFAAP